MPSQKNLRTCDQGHEYYKSSLCPVCPICENNRKPFDDFLSRLSAPARRALEHEGILNLKQLARKTESDILKLHGMGPSSIPKLKSALASQGLSFRKKIS